MNLILHQLKTDVEHFRWWLAVSWLAFAANAALLCADSLPSDAQDILKILVILWQIYNGVFLIAALVQADSLVGTNAAWLSRPIRRLHLFWAKSAFIVLLILMPQLAAQSAAWILLGYTPHLWLCAAGENLLFSVAFALTVALLASLTHNLAHFFLAIAIMVGGIFAWAVTVGMLRRIGAIIPHAAGPWFEQSSFQDSVTAAALLIFIGMALIAWIAQARIKWALVAGLFFALGLASISVVITIWPVNFLKPRLIKSVPLTVFAQAGDSPARVPSVQALSTELAVSGVPKLDVAIMQSLTGSIKFKRGPEFPVDQKSSPFLKRVEPMESQQRGEYVRLIKKCFPAQTLWFDQGNDKKESAFSNLYQDPWFKKSKPPRLATIQGNMELDLFGIEKVAEVPLQPATFHALPANR